MIASAWPEGDMPLAVGPSGQHRDRAAPPPSAGRAETFTGGRVARTGPWDALALRPFSGGEGPGSVVQQRARACDRAPGPDGECTRCQAERLALQRFAISGRPAPAPRVVIDVLRSPGAPLDAPTRAHMQHRLGADLSGVRVHTDDRAAASARAVDALAYTVGRSIVFDRGRYAPQHPEGRALLAHELVHTIQQGGRPPAHGRSLHVEPTDTSSEREARDVATTAAVRPRGGHAPAVQRQGGGAAPFGPVCDANRARRPCRQARCTPDQRTVLAGDLARAQGYMGTALQKVAAGQASSLLEWHFNSSSRSTRDAVLARLRCINQVLASAVAGGEWGCDPDYSDRANAYVCVGGVDPAACSPETTDLCFTASHFSNGPDERASTAIHEAGHRIGLSAGELPDIYTWRPRFRYMDTDTALANTDSFAHFVVDVATGASLSLVARALGWPGVSLGAAVPSTGPATWIAQLSFVDLEFQSPRLDMFQPSLGLQMTLIGERSQVGAVSLSGRSLFTLAPEIIGGLRIGDARPGSPGGGFAQLTGSAGLAITQTGRGEEYGFTGSAGISVGYRWRWMEAGAGLGYRYDQTGTRIGAQHLTVPHAFVNISLFDLVHEF